MTTANEDELEGLFSTGAIAAKRGWVFDTRPAVPSRLDFDRVEGMMLGLAIGDSLGNTNESLLPATRRARYGEIRDYLANSRAGGRAVGLPSDDSQLAFWTLEQLIADGGYRPERLADRFCSGRIFGIGATVREFIVNHKDRQLRWSASGPRSAGNGALMRIAPMLIPHLRAPSAALWADTALSAMTTHNDTASIASCVAFEGMLWELLDMARPPAAAWWSERFLALASAVEDESAYTPRGGRYAAYEGPFSQYVEHVLGAARARNLTVLEAADEWFSGAFLLETVPTVLYILTLYAAYPEEAIVRAVNDTKDNDTIAAIVGAAVGALHGRGRLPARWVSGLSGRTSERDDGRMEELLAAAKRAFG